MFDAYRNYTVITIAYVSCLDIVKLKEKDILTVTFSNEDKNKNKTSK